MVQERFAVVDDDLFVEHRPARRHPERPERLEAARKGLYQAIPSTSRLLLEPRDATRAELELVHEPRFLDGLDKTLDRGWADVDADTYVSPGSRAAALRAAGGAIALGEALATGVVKRGFALLRPPGHHAEPARAMGFCLYDNVALAARAAQAAGAAKVAIIDWDVHHGNGTQEAFWNDASVFFASLHQWPLYPGTGAASEAGGPDAIGRNANVCMPAGAGRADYVHAFQDLLLPALRGFAPDLLLVSAGFDAHAADPLAGVELEAEDFAALSTAMVDVAEELGHGRVGLILEGGYDLAALAESVEASARAAAGERFDLSAEPPSRALRDALSVTKRAMRVS